MKELCEGFCTSQVVVRCLTVTLTVTVTLAVTMTVRVNIPLFLKTYGCLVCNFEHKTQQVLHLQYQVLFYGHRMNLQLSHFCHCHWSVVPLRFFINNKIIILPLTIISQQYSPISYISSTSHYTLYIIYTLICNHIYVHFAIDLQYILK